MGNLDQRIDFMEHQVVRIELVTISNFLVEATEVGISFTVNQLGFMNLKAHWFNKLKVHQLVEGINLSFKLQNLIMDQLAYLQNCFNFKDTRYQGLEARLRAMVKVVPVLLVEVRQDARDYFNLSYLFALTAIKQPAKASLATRLTFTMSQIDFHSNFVFINQTIGLATLKLAGKAIKVATILRSVKVKAVVNLADQFDANLPKIEFKLSANQSIIMTKVLVGQSSFRNANQATVWFKAVPTQRAKEVTRSATMQAEAEAGFITLQSKSVFVPPAAHLGVVQTTDQLIKVIASHTNCIKVVAGRITDYIMAVVSHTIVLTTIRVIANTIQEMATAENNFITHITNFRV